MAEALAIVGGLAAGLQLVTMAGKALLATIKLTQDIRNVPAQLGLLLNEVSDSITRLCNVCGVGSKALEKLDPARLEHLSRIAGVLQPALQEIHDMLAPLVGGGNNNNGNRRLDFRQLWKSLVSLKIEKELSPKLERLNRLNLEMVRELGVLGLEVQVTTQGLIMANNAIASSGFSNLKTEMDSLRSDFQSFTLSVKQTHATTLTNLTNLAPGHVIIHQPQGSNLGQQDDWELVSRPQNIMSGSPALVEPSLGNGGRLPQEREEQLRRYLAARYDSGSIAPGPQAPNVRTAGLEFLLFSIRAFYTTGNFDASPVVPRPKFWNDMDQAIYLMKITAGQKRGSSKSEARGLRLLRVSTTVAPNVFNETRAIVLIELLSTLSPVNTATCPYVREGMLSYLNELAREQLPPGHPITLVIRSLRTSSASDEDVSFRALTFLTDRLHASLGPLHELTLLATKKLCSLLRRSRHFTEALRVATNSARAIRAQLGPGSLQERGILRLVEHVYMDQTEWEQALSVCFDIVGQQNLDQPDPDPKYHDECAVYTMEDIAKTCECVGNLELAAAWLKQARISGGMVWGGSTPVAHIQDKLEELLRQMNKKEELELWNTMTGFPTI